MSKNIIDFTYVLTLCLCHSSYLTRMCAYSHGIFLTLLFQGYVECPAEFLYEEFTQRIEEVSKWNPTILESKLIQVSRYSKNTLYWLIDRSLWRLWDFQRIDHETDITYQLTAGGGGGAIKPRDFVNLRRNTRVGDRFISCGTSVEYPGYPPTKKYIRYNFLN